MVKKEVGETDSVPGSETPSGKGVPGLETPSGKGGAMVTMTDTETPAVGKGKKLGIKRIKKKPDLNISKGKLKSVNTPKNFSFLNMSVQKQTLRANNRALAQNLAKARQDIRQLNTEVQMLRSQNQDQCVELNRLKRLVGLKDEGLQHEVQQRIQDEMQGMRHLLEELTQSMMQSSTFITKVYDKCLMYCSRRSTDSSRSVSLGSSQGNQSLNRRSSRSSFKDLGSKDDLMAKYLSKADEFTAPPGSRIFADTSNSADMSIIAEQSMLDGSDDEVLTAHPLTSLEETSSEVGPVDAATITKPLSKLPQRVLKYIDTAKSNCKINSSDLTGKNTEPTSDDIIDLTKMEKSGKSASSQVKCGKRNGSQSGKSKETEKVKGRSSDDDDQCKDGRSKAKQISKQNVNEHQEIDLDADVSAFGFGGSFAADLVSGSPISASDLVSGSPISSEKRRETFVLTKQSGSTECKPTDMQKRRETFVKSKEVEISEDKKSGKEGNEKVKDTFAVPKAPLQNSVKEKKDNRKGNETKTNSSSQIVEKSKKKENNDKVHLKTKEKRRETYTAENPFVPKMSRVQRSPVKQVIEEGPAYDSVADPFKPTKTLIRSPVHVSVEKASPEKKNDSLAFLAKLRESLESKLVESSPLPDPEIPDEPTTYFNSEMDFTAVIDSTKFLQTLSKSQKNSPDVHMEEANETEQRTNSMKNPKQHEASKSKDLGKAGSSEKVDIQEEIGEAAAVEVRTKKPGVFTFSVARKEADGTRKAIPEKVSKARSKKKKPVTPEKEERKTGPDRDMFCFGDRTPTVPLDKLSKAKNVYDLSMNESVAAPLVSLKNFNEKEPQKKSESKEQDQIYYVPLKESSEEKPTSKRARSQSRSRSKSRKTCEDDDEDWVPGGKSHARSKSRGRSSGDEETTKRRGRSQSRRRVTNDDETDAKEIAVDKVSRARSRPRSSKVEAEEILLAIGRRGRSRSQARTINYDENSQEDEEEVICSRETESVNLKRSHDEMSGTTDKLSRSKSRKERDVSEEKEKRRGRSRSRARPGKDSKELDCGEIESKSEQENARTSPAPRRSARSKSQARKPVHDGDNEDIEISPQIQRKPRSRSVHRRKTHEIKGEGDSKSDDDKSEKIKNFSKESELLLQYPKTVPAIVVPDSDDSESQDSEDWDDSKKASKEKTTPKSSEHHAVVEESESDSEKIQKLERSRRKSRRDAKSSKYDEKNFENDIEPNKNETNVTDLDGKEFDRNFAFINKRRCKSTRIPDAVDDNEEVKISENTEESCDVGSKKKSVNSEYVDNRHAESPKVNKKTEEVKVSKSVKKSTKKRKPEDTDTKLGKSKQNITEKLDKDGDSVCRDEIAKSSITPAKVPEGSKKSARTRTGKSARKVKADPLPDQTPITKDEKTNHGTDKPDALALLKKRLTMVGVKHSVNEDKTKDEEMSRKRSKDEIDGHQVDESDSPENKRSRRNKNPVSYVPKPLNVKLRQGDKMFQDNVMSKVKAEQNRLAIAKKMSVPKISRDDKENIQQT